MMEKHNKGENWDSRRIKALRKHLKLTQTGMAGEMGTRQQTISEWENGQYQPRGASSRLLSIIADRSHFEYRARPK